MAFRAAMCNSSCCSILFWLYFSLISFFFSSLSLCILSLVVTHFFLSHFFMAFLSALILFHFCFIFTLCPSCLDFSLTFFIVSNSRIFFQSHLCSLSAGSLLARLPWVVFAGWYPLPHARANREEAWDSCINQTEPNLLALLC